PTCVEDGLNASHISTPHHVLFEGNYSQNMDNDYTHGNSIDVTFFRNWASGKRRDFADNSTYCIVRTAGLSYGARWMSFIGNVLGRPGQMSGWNLADPSMKCDSTGGNCKGGGTAGNWQNQDIWMLGYDPERWNMVPDPLVLSTVI